MAVSFAPAGRCSLLASQPSSRISVADETAVVLWDPNTHTEHLIDRVTFGGQPGAPFGYIIPTPVVPRIESAPDDPTHLLNRVYHPKFVRVENTGIQAVSGLDWIREQIAKPQARKGAAGASAADSQPNAYYQAVTFDAADSEGISAWLKTNGFAESPGLAKWLKPYAFRQWVVTAFLIDPARTAQKVVRPPAFTLTFRSYRPYFPYREPADSAQPAPGQNSRLRIYLVTDARMTASPSQHKDVWTGTTRWATPLPEDLTNQLNSDIASEFSLLTEQMPPHPWLTVLQEDSPAHGSASDLLFTPAPNQEEQVPVVTVVTDKRIKVPADLCAIGVGTLVALGIMQRAARRANARRRRQAKAAAALAARDAMIPGRVAEPQPPPTPPRTARPAPMPMSAPPRSAPSQGPAYKKTRKRSKSGLRAFVQRLLNRKSKQAPAPPRRATAANLLEPWNGQPATSVKRSDLLADVLERQDLPPETDITPWIEIPTTMVSAPKSFSVDQVETFAKSFSVGPAETNAPGEPAARIPVWIKGEAPPPDVKAEPPVLVVHPPKRSPFKRRRRTDGEAYLPAIPEEDGGAYQMTDRNEGDGIYHTPGRDEGDEPGSLPQ